jgi:hypothetical protein
MALRFLPEKLGESFRVDDYCEENRANFCKCLDGKLNFSALDGMYTVTLIELKAVSTQAKIQSCSERILIGINGPGRRFPESKGTQEPYL